MGWSPTGWDVDPRLTDRRQRAMAAHGMTADARTAPRFRVASAPLPRVRATVRPPAVTRCCASNQRGMGCGSTSDQMWWQLGTRARMAPMGADAGGEARARRRRSDGCTPRPSSPSDRLLLSVLDLASAAFCASAPARQHAARHRVQCDAWTSSVGLHHKLARRSSVGSYVRARTLQLHAPMIRRGSISHPLRAAVQRTASMYISVRPPRGLYVRPALRQLVMRPARSPTACFSPCST